MGAVSISGDNPETVCTVTAVVGLNLDSAKGEEATCTVVIEAIESLRRFCLLAREDLWRRASEGSVGSDGGVESAWVCGSVHALMLALAKAHTPSID